jgi:hypothetical protein
MPADDAQGNRPRTTQAQEGSTGPAQRMDPGGARPRGPQVLSKEDLDARQAAISPRRKGGGPPLERTRSGEDPAEAAPDVPPTDCADPPTE